MYLIFKAFHKIPAKLWHKPAKNIKINVCGERKFFEVKQQCRNMILSNKKVFLKET